MEPAPSQTAYPLPSGVLRPAWHNSGARALATIAVAAAAAAIVTRWPVHLADVDDITLHILLPAGAAFVFAFAPAPATLVGRIARTLTVLGLAASVFAGATQPLLIACYPLLLMTAVAAGEIETRRRARSSP